MVLAEGKASFFGWPKSAVAVRAASNNMQLYAVGGSGSDRQTCVPTAGLTSSRIPYSNS